eukprot:XP_001697376.1 predicted protein [Chlamydomonas reinhardtii]
MAATTQRDDMPANSDASAPAGPAPAAGRPGRLLGGIHAAPGALPIPHADRQELQQHHAHVVPQQTVQHQTAMPAASAHGAQAMSISQDREEGERHMDDMGVHYEPHIDLLMKGKGGEWAQDPPVVRIANGDDLGFQEVQPRRLHAQGQTHTAPDPAPAPAPAPHYRDRHDHRDEPRVVIHAFTGVLKGTITNIATWFDVLVMILSRRGIDPVASFLMYLGGQAQQWGLTWFRAWEREHNRQPTVDELRHDFLMQWDNPHLHTANAARQRLHNHEVTQTGTVSAYITQFRLIMQDIPDMHMNDRVAHFRAGLQKGLQAKYAFKPGSTVPWDNVYELMNHILEMTTATNFANGKTQPSVAAADTPASRSPSLPARLHIIRLLIPAVLTL